MSRAELARRQAALVEALVRGGPPPPGFDPVGLRATADVLLRKRAAAAAAHWPLLAAALGTRWPETFRAWVAGRAPVGGWRDGWDLARDLAATGGLPDLAWSELAAREAAWRYDGHTTPRRRPWPSRWWRTRRRRPARGGGFDRA